MDAADPWLSKKRATMKPFDGSEDGDTIIQLDGPVETHVLPLSNNQQNTMFNDSLLPTKSIVKTVVKSGTELTPLKGKTLEDTNAEIHEPKASESLCNMDSVFDNDDMQLVEEEEKPSDILCGEEGNVGNNRDAPSNNCVELENDVQSLDGESQVIFSLMQVDC